MINLKKLFTVLAVFSLLGGQAVAQWSPPLGSQDEVGLAIVENFATTGDQASRLFAVSKSSLYGGMPDQILCDSYSPGDCEFTTTSASGTLILPACDTADSENCISELAVTIDGQQYIANFIRQVEGPKVAEDLKRGLPAGSTVSIWQVIDSDGTAHDFAVYSSLLVTGFVNGKFRIGDLSSNVTPYRAVPGSQYHAPVVEQLTQDSGRRAVGTRNAAPECVFTEEGLCGSPLDFEEDQKVSLTLRITNQVGGWFRGRMKETSIAVSAFSNSADLIKVSGKPVEVPTLGFSIPQTEAPEDFMSWVKQSASGWIGGVMNTRVDYPSAWTYLAKSRSILKDAASGVVRVWSFGSTGKANNLCGGTSSDVLGIVTTNATVYQPGAPSYSKGFLNYKVGGLHYLPDGETLFEGSYDLVVRSDVARCLYKFSSAPVSATISVSGTGDKSVATTVVSEKNGWLKLAAYGFTFSEKTLKIKLSQKKTTITCVSKTNKKKSKKVTGYSPKCPTGYKKK